MENNQHKSYLLPASILIAAILVSGALVYNAGSGKVAQDNGDNAALTANVKEVLQEAASGRIVLGDPQAPVQIVEFGDFQCPFCGKFHQESGDKIREEYIKTGKASMVYMDLSFLGDESVQAALAAQCAGEQGKYWAYHDQLYSYLWDNYYAQGKNGENVGAFSDSNLKKFAKDLSLSESQFNECLDSKKYMSKLEETSAAAEAVLGGRISTPSVFINGKLIQGAQPYTVFKDAIEEALKNN